MSWPVGQFDVRIEEAADGSAAAATIFAGYACPDPRRIHTAWVLCKAIVACDLIAGVYGVNMGANQIGTITITDAAAIGDIFEMVWDPLATLQALTPALAYDQQFDPAVTISVDVNVQPTDLTAAAALFDVYLALFTA